MKKRKAVIVLLAVLLLLSAGCRANVGELPAGTQPAETSAGTGGAALPAPDEWIALTENGQPLYAFVYQQTGVPDAASAADYATLARKLAADWEERSGVAFQVWSDRRIPDDITGVIAIGNVSGYAGDAFEGLLYNDFRVSGDEGCIVVAAYTYAFLWIAAERINDALTLSEGELYLNRSALSISHHSSYPIGSLTVGGTPVSDYHIDCTEAERPIAEWLILTVRNTSGNVLELADGSDAKRIVIRRTEGLNGYRITRTGIQYRLEYGDGLSESLLRLYLENCFSNVTGGDALEMDDLVTLSERGEERKVLTLNVLDVWQNNATPGERDDIVAELISSYLPDFVCLQEFDISYRNAPGGLLSKTEELYSEVPVTGVEANNIWNPILYRTELYEVVASGLIDLAEVAGAVESSTYPGSADGVSSFRKLVWAVLRDRTDGSIYLIGNFHASVSLSTHPAEAEAIAQTVEEVAGQYQGCITLLCGDYNSNRTQAHGVLEQLRQSGFTDTYDSAKIRSDSGTWHDLGQPPSGSYMGSAIDHILTLGGIDAQVYLILNDEELLSASDHCPTVLAFTKS